MALKQKRLEEEAALKQKAFEEETSFKHKFEMFQASQQLEETVLELQVLHEEKDRGGYISSSEELIDLTADQVVQSHFTISCNEDKLVDNQTSASMPEIVIPLAVTKDKPTVSGPSSH